MNNAPVKTVLLPATLTVGVVFCLLTSVLVGDKLKPSLETLSSNSAPQYLLREQKRNLAIRNVGFSILVSAAAGMGVAVGIRRSQGAIKQATRKHEAISQPIAEFLSSRPE